VSTLLRHSIIMDVVEVGAVPVPVSCSFGYILFIVQDFQLGNFIQIFNATGIAPRISSHIIE
jgi:hypothetical protein